jgi:hypothetical protein
MALSDMWEDEYDRAAILLLRLGDQIFTGEYTNDERDKLESDIKTWYDEHKDKYQ